MPHSTKGIKVSLFVLSKLLKYVKHNIFDRELNECQNTMRSVNLIQFIRGFANMLLLFVYFIL